MSRRVICAEPRKPPNSVAPFVSRPRRRYRPSLSQCRFNSLVAMVGFACGKKHHLGFGEEMESVVVCARFRKFALCGYCS